MVERTCDDSRAENTRGSLELAAIYRTEGARVARWIQRLDPEGDTEDLLQEVFLVVKRRLPEFRGDAAIGTWLHAVTVRVVVAERRKRKVRRFLLGRETEKFGAEQPPPHTPEELLQGRELGRLLYELLDRLSERDRTLLILHELEGLAGAELAAVTGLSANGVWVALHRARARLRTAYVGRARERGDR
ncbi:MAG TPA: sigma-70 family RNA polymerase sigma factor [Polyangiaceae bacterium]|nr:sigma-70 family RNA polymerase sigma factor [Polyangiaceae bacterium]